MAIARGFKLFPTLFLVLSWQYCAKVDATFSDVTGFFERNFDLGTFGSGGVGILTNIKGNVGPHIKTFPTKLAPSIAPVGLQTPKLAPSIGPVWLQTPMNEVDKASSLIISKEIKGGGGFSNGHEINLKSGGNIALSHGGIISRKIKGGGEFGPRS